MKVKMFGLFSLFVSVLVLCSCVPVTLETVPDGAEIYDDNGVFVGAAPQDIAIFTSSKDFVLKRENYADTPVTVDSMAARTVQFKMKYEPIMVTSEPSGAKISCDSLSYGKTPNKIMPKNTDRIFTFKADGYYDKEVVIGADSPHPLHVVMQKLPILAITSAGADIFENGAKIGTGAISVEIDKTRTFEFRKAGFFSETRTVSAVPPYQLNVDLKAFPMITVDSVPPAAKIFRDGTQTGTAPMQFTVDKEITVELRADRYYPQTVTLTPASTAKTVVTLNPMPYATVNAVLADAQVFVDGKSLGTAPVEILTEKAVTVEIRKDGFISKTATVPAGGKSISVTLEPEPKIKEPAVEPVTAPAAPAGSDSGDLARIPAEEDGAMVEAAGGMSKGMLWGIIGGATALLAIIIAAAAKKKK
ncbi:MAG: PEGA domain-containing protein [Kiritimatiellales bacterium]